MRSSLGHEAEVARGVHVVVAELGLGPVTSSTRAGSFQLTPPDDPRQTPDGRRRASFGGPVTRQPWS